MQGKRVYGKAPHLLQPGEYMVYEHDQNAIYGRTPNGLLCNLKSHTITEHPDGTITASPSILVSGAPESSWHGYLERGIWRQC